MRVISIYEKHWKICRRSEMHFIYTKYYIGKTTVEDYLFAFINNLYNVYLLK